MTTLDEVLVHGEVHRDDYCPQCEADARRASASADTKEEMK